jgi:hypothetical protein
MSCPLESASTNPVNERTRMQSQSGYKSAASSSTGVMPAARAPTTST